jgi:hypothetical protein
MSTTRYSLFGLAVAVVPLLVFAHTVWPTITPGLLPGSDAQEYAHLSQSLLHGSYLVDYDGPPRLTRYTPGFSILLMPAVALGGMESGVWVPYLSALVLGILAGLLAWRIGGGLAPTFAVLLVLINAGVFLFAQLTMSDLPSAAIGLMEVTLLALAVGRRSVLSAGFLAGLLVWMRPGFLVLVLAGIAGLSAARNWKWRAAWYMAGLIPPLLLLAAWQWFAFGSPLVTSYQATGVGVKGSELSGFFSLGYVFGQPWNTYSAGIEPNGLVYPRVLLGFGTDFTYPGVGLLGLVSAVVLALRSGPAGILGRFTLMANAVMLLLYVPYFFRDERFLILPIALNDIAAAVMVARGFSAARSILRTRWPQELSTAGHAGDRISGSALRRGS